MLVDFAEIKNKNCLVRRKKKSRTLFWFLSSNIIVIIIIIIILHNMHRNVWAILPHFTGAYFPRYNNLLTYSRST